MSPHAKTFVVYGSLAAAFLVGCQKPAQIETLPSNCDATSASLTEEAPLDTPAATAKPRQVTFYGDVLPILSANESGRSYKCTTCHHHYSTPEGLGSVDEVEAVMGALTSGRMPRGGDPVTEAEIEIFRVWRLQGFQPGEAAPAPLAGGGGGGSGARGCG